VTAGVGEHRVRYVLVNHVQELALLHESQSPW
jgi:hypothetical protein